jgi:hypothetical protein
MNKNVAKFLYDIVDASISSVALGQSRVVRFTLSGSAYPLHFCVERTPHAQMVVSSNDQDLFSGQGPSLVVLADEPYRNAHFVRSVFKAVTQCVDSDYVEGRMVKNFHSPQAKSPEVLVGNSNFGTLDPEPDRYSL